MLNMNKSLLSVLALGFSLVLNAQAKTAEKTTVEISNSEVRKPVFFKPDYDIGGSPLNIRDEDDFSGYDILAKAIGDKRYVFSGEDHRPLRFNALFETKLMRYLHQEKGFNYMFLEFGHASTLLLNRYLLEGDSLAEVEIKRYFHPEYYAMFKTLREINQSNDSLPKIKVQGLDIEREMFLAMSELVRLIPDGKAIPDSMSLFLESARMFAGGRAKLFEDYNEQREYSSDDPFDFSGQGVFDQIFDYFEPAYLEFNSEAMVKLMLLNYERNQETFHTFFQAQEASFKKLMTELSLWQQWTYFSELEVPQGWALRESYMESNLVQFIAQNPDVKGFGQFGRCHISKDQHARDCHLGFFNSLNSRIARNHPEIGAQLVSIGLYYDGLGDEFPESLRSLAATRGSSTATLYVDIDSLQDPEVSAKFDMVILAKGKKSARYSGSEAPYQNTLGFGYSAIYQNLDLGAFNTATRLNVSTPLLVHEFSYLIRMGGRVWIDNTFGSIAKTTGSFMDTTGLAPADQINRKMSLSGWNYRYAIGYDVFKSSSVDLVPIIAIQYQQLTYREESFGGQATSFNSATRTEFTNPAFLLDGRINLALNFDWFSINALAGYSVDFSKTQWLSGDSLLEAGPKTRQSNLYYGAGISVRFDLDN